MKTLVAVADLGRLKAFELVRGHGDSRAHLELVDKSRQEEMRTKLSEQLTDSFGRFQRMGGARGGEWGVADSGERHDLKLEQERRAVQAIAAELDGLLEGDRFDACWLATAKPIQNPLLDALGPEARGKVQKVLGLDLTKADPGDVLDRFEAV